MSCRDENAWPDAGSHPCDGTLALHHAHGCGVLPVSRTALAPGSLTVLTRTGKKDRQINTFVLRTETNPPRTLYKKNLRVEPAAFLDGEVPSRVLENIKQKLVS